MEEMTPVSEDKKISEKYELTIDLNTLNHLGIGLYSNIPAVISEVVANSWDADASRVEINIDRSAKTIEITDDGWGMSKDELNRRYLKVGYNKRENESVITPKGRHVMGRKGIGKLSLFSIAETIEVHSVKSSTNNSRVGKHGFIMRTPDIERTIKAGRNSYHPDPVESKEITIDYGTKILLRDLKRGVDTTEYFLRKRLARRFSIISHEYDFSVSVNGDPITVQDRDYFKKIEYLWYIGDGGEKYVDYCSNSNKQTSIDGVIDEENGYRISGWVGTFDEQKSVEEGNNTIVVLAWGKLIHEDILKDIKEGGIFTKYLIGEIRADFLDLDDMEDIATSDRQNLKENDPRFLKLRSYIQEHILKDIQSKWRDWRNEGATEKALENPKIKEWFEGLSPDNKKYAKKLFGKIESFPISDPNYKKELYKHGVLAFEALALKDHLSTLDKLDTEKDFDLITTIFSNLDELEATHYWQITKNRVGVLKAFEEMAPTAQEKLIQKFIFDHIWLLDPSWERASTDQRMEETVQKEWGKIDAQLTDEEKKGRFDIKYRTAAGKHIIVELKRYERKVKTTELIEQIYKYRRALEKCIEKTYPNRHYLIEVICILGYPPEPADRDVENRNMLESVNTRYILYDELIQQTRNSYRDYLDKQREISRIQQLIDSI